MNQYKIKAPLGSIVVSKEVMTEDEIRAFLPQLIQDPDQSETWKEKAKLDPIEQLVEWLENAGYTVKINPTMTSKQRIEKIVGRELPDDFIEKSKMSLRGKEVLKLRFGFEDGITRTLEEVGKQFGVTRERIRQIEGKAFEMLRQEYGL